MDVKDLQARMGNVEVVVVVAEKGDVREFEKFGKQGKVCNAVVKDDSGSVKLTLWNDDIDKVNVGDKIKIANGWVGEYQGELQLSTGKFGTLDVVEKGAGAPTQEPTEPTGEELSEEPIDDEEAVG